MPDRTSADSARLEVTFSINQFTFLVFRESTDNNWENSEKAKFE